MFPTLQVPESRRERGASGHLEEERRPVGAANADSQPQAELEEVSDDVQPVAIQVSHRSDD